MAAQDVVIEPSLLEEATELDNSPLNRSNIAFSRLSMKIARSLLNSKPSLEGLEGKFSELALAFKSHSPTETPPFCCVEGVKYAINAKKVSLIQEEGHVMITVPFYCEFERGRPATDANPNGEESPIQKIEEALFLLSFNDKISMDLIFVNDTIAEKKDEKDGGSALLFKQSLLKFVEQAKLKISIVKQKDRSDNEDDFDSFSTLNERLCVTFTSCEEEAIKGSYYESPDTKRKRFENRGPDGKLRERKGGAVLAGMEMEYPHTVKNPKRVIRCLVDGDSAHPVASFIGDAAYSIFSKGHTAYLGNLKHADTVISVAGEDGGGGSDSTQARVQNRKLFFSGFIVPFLFPELSLKYQYTGTTQLPIKAFRGNINFAKAKLTTVQPNVDLGMLALLCFYLNTDGGSIDSGSITIRDNIASSTMTSSDLKSEWTKTYGPIFTSAVGLCRDYKPTEFEQLPSWLTSFIENMELIHYATLFGDDSTSNPDVIILFTTMKEFLKAKDRAAVLQKLKAKIDKIFT
jgi:hypothetical protein